MAKIKLSRKIKEQYSEIVPVLSGRGGQCSLTLLGRRRDDPSQLEKIVTHPWKPTDNVSIEWVDEGTVTSAPRPVVLHHPA
jgi:hypothetical protein